VTDLAARSARGSRRIWVDLMAWSSQKQLWDVTLSASGTNHAVGAGFAGEYRRNLHAQTSVCREIFADLSHYREALKHNIQSMPKAIPFDGKKLVQDEQRTDPGGGR